MELLNQPETPKKTKAQAADWSSAIKAIETNFMFSDEHYTHNMKKVRNWKQGIFTQEPEQENVLVNVDVETTYGNNPTVSTDDAYRNATLKRFEAANPPDPCDLYDVPSDDDSATSSQMDDVIEIDLGHKMVKTLDEMFGGESYKVEIEKNKKLTSKVFMTRSMARQLHALWLESVYSQAEEEKLQRFKEDEEMAKKLMNNLSEYSNPPEPQKSDNLDEIMDMQMALDSYQKQVRG